MRGRILRVLSAFIMIAMIVPLIGTKVSADSKAYNLYQYVICSGTEVGDDGAYMIKTPNEFNEGFTSVIARDGELWLGCTKDYGDNKGETLLIVYDVIDETIEGTVLHIVINEDCYGIFMVDNLTTSYEPGQDLTYSDRMVTNLPLSNYKYHAYANSVVDVAMGNIQKLLLDNGYSLADLGFTSQKFAGAPAPVVPTPTPTVAPTAKPTAVPTKAPAATTTPSTTAPTKAPAATTVPSGKPTVAPTKAPAAPTSTPSDKESGVEGFVERLYTVAMDRDSDKDGKAYWTKEVKENGKSGADIAREFLYSEEFLGKNMSQDDFLTVLYRTFFDREPDASGLKFWKDQMSAGQTKEWVIAGFINSEEWANICLSFGIRSGSSVAPTITIVPNENVIGFATRLYTTCLKREFDPEGLDFWAKELANLRRTGSEAAKGFFFSDEIDKSGISDSEFLTRLYKTLMNREPEKEGFDYWLGQMKSGAMSRESVFDGFAASAEWIGICADYGILR